MNSNDLFLSQIVICDDSLTNTLVLSKLMESDGFKNVNAFTDPRKVVPFIKERSEGIDLLVIDIEMPHMSGFDVINQLRAEVPGHQDIAILIITGLRDKEIRHRGLMAGAGDFVTKPFDQVEVLLRLRNMLQVHHALKMQKNLARQLELAVEKRTAELDKANDLLVQLLALAGEMRDGETGKHVARVGRYSRILSDAIGLPPEIGFLIEKAAPLHDIGKVGIPDSILLKKQSLDDAEREVMNSHTLKGLQLLGEFGHDSVLIQMAASIALTHHERWDGKGYPNAKQGESIPIEGRITAICDVFDALTTQRPYKDAWSVDEAVVFLKENAGGNFDAALVDAFVSRLDEFVAAMNELKD